MEKSSNSNMVIMKKFLLILFFLPLVSQGQKYFQTTYETIGSWRAFVSKPANYSTQSPKRYPVFVFIPGNGEVGTDSNDLKTYGPHYFINSGAMPAVINPVSGDTLECIIISLQPSGQWPAQASIASRIDTIISHSTNRWRVDSFKVTLSGLSAGGWAAANYVTGSTRQGQRITANVLMHHPITDNGATDAIKHGNMATYARNGGKIWGFEDSTGDYRKMNITRDSMNRAISGSYRYTGRPTVTGGHCCWNTWYDPTYTENIGGTNYNVYQWALTQARSGAYDYWGTPGSLTANAGNDTAYIYDQGAVAVPFSLSGSAENATSPTYSWAALSGNPSATTITSSSSSTTTVTGANVAGFYGYELTVTDGTSDKDTVYIQLRDLLERGLRPCREGAKIRRYLGDSLASGRITTTEIYLQYITRDGFLTNVMGGDTVVILKNPNNVNGYWTSITIGDISGSPGCPIVFVPDTSGITRVSAAAGGSRGWYIANADTNTTAYVKFDGGAWYSRTGVRHGFQANNSQYSYDSSDVITNSLNTGIAAQLIHHVEFTGWLFNNTGHGIQMKKNSDSTKVFTIWNNFRQVGNSVRYSYFYKTNYEGIYAGHTDWNGTSQAGNDGRTLMQDSLIIEKNVFHKTGLDGIQVANHGNGAIVRDNVVYQSGYRNGSSHRWSIFIGGNANGDMYRNTIVNARGPAGSLGSGTVRFYQNIIDSVNDGGNVESGMYINKSAWTGNTDSLKMFIYDNVISRIAQTGNYSHIYVVNSAGLMSKGAIRNNTIVSSKGTNIQTAASDTVENNTTVSSLDISTHALASMDSYRVYRELLTTQAAGTPVSFLDLVIRRNYSGRKHYHKGRKFNFKY